MIPPDNMSCSNAGLKAQIEVHFRTYFEQVFTFYKLFHEN